MNIAYFFPVLGYFAGAIPMGYLVGRLYHIDIRHQGSGNIGATNAQRTLGTKAGILVLVLDLAKVLLVLFAGVFLQLPREVLLLTAAAAIIGHDWPIYLRFKGGKGVAVSAGMLVFFYPWPGLVTVLLFILIVALTKYVSLGSILSSALVPPMLFALRYPLLDVAYTAFLACLLIWLHRENIGRLRLGTERRIQFGTSHH